MQTMRLPDGHILDMRLAEGGVCIRLHPSVRPPSLGDRLVFDSLGAWVVVELLPVKGEAVEVLVQITRKVG